MQLLIILLNKIALLFVEFFGLNLEVSSIFLLEFGHPCYVKSNQTLQFGFLCCNRQFDQKSQIKTSSDEVRVTISLVRAGETANHGSKNQKNHPA